MTTQTTEELPPAFDDVVALPTFITLSPRHDINGPILRTDGIAQTSRAAVTMPNLLEQEEEETQVDNEEQLPEYGQEEDTTHADDDELPPEYGQEAGLPQLPDYAERHLLEPVVSYGIYQINRRLQVLTPANRSTLHRPRYRVTSRLGPSVFSKKPDYTLTRLPTGVTAATENTPGKDVGFASFDRAGELPWMPRATVEVMSGHLNGARKIAYDLYAPNFADWKFQLNNEMYYWRLTDRPIALSLVEHSSDSVVARFTYSNHGTDASRGAEVGTLSIFGGYRSGDTETIEVVLSSWVVAVNHWKNMGKHYRNTATPRNYSVAAPVGMGMGNSFFARDGRHPGPRRASNAV